MTSNSIARFLIVVVAILAGASAEGRGNAKVSDVDAVNAVLSAFSDALAAGDGAKIWTLAVDRFVLIKDGHRFEVERTGDSIGGGLRTGTIARRPGPFHTTVRGDVAWSHYDVEGQYRSLDGSEPLNLIECAVLVRERGEWRVVQMVTMEASLGLRLP